MTLISKSYLFNADVPTPFAASNYSSIPLYPLVVMLMRSGILRTLCNIWLKICIVKSQTADRRPMCSDLWADSSEKHAKDTHRC